MKIELPVVRGVLKIKVVKTKQNDLERHHQKRDGKGRYRFAYPKSCGKEEYKESDSCIVFDIVGGKKRKRKCNNR